MKKVCRSEFYSFLHKFKLINLKEFGHALISIIETIKRDLFNALYVCGIFWLVFHETYVCLFLGIFVKCVTSYVFAHSVNATKSNMEVLLGSSI